jgi:AAA domain-containing protein
MAYEAVPATRSEEPLLLGMIGPPGGGKTLSSLKLAKGIQSVRGGDIVLLDTEGGRSRKYGDQIPFNIVELQNAKSDVLLEAIRAQLASKPAAIIVDSMSDEHETYLEWHDAEVKNFGGNEWAAWSKPKAARKRLITGILKIKTPLIFTFRAREKTKQNPEAKEKKDKIINIGWQPVAPLEIVHTLDLACLLPPRADGVPIWKSEKIGEDFVLKLPNYLAPYIAEGRPLCEEMGANFARWARGDSAAPVRQPAGATDEYIERWRASMKSASNAEHGRAMADAWNAEKTTRDGLIWEPGSFEKLQQDVRASIKLLKEPA